MRTLIFLLLIALAGCAAKNTTVVLIEDPDGSVGRVTIKTPAGEQTLSSARQSTAVQASEAPTPVRVVDQAEIDDKYGTVLKILPLPVETFILYFESGTSDLTSESLPLTEKILASIAHRQSTDVRVYGHSDRVGTSEVNQRLSLERAEATRTILENLGIAKDIIQVSSHGEGNPLVPTEDEVSEPRNRRVEVLIR